MLYLLRLYPLERLQIYRYVSISEAFVISKQPHWEKKKRFLADTLRKMEIEAEVEQSKFKRICVFCGSSQGKKTSYQDAAIQLGKELVFDHCLLVCLLVCFVAVFFSPLMNVFFGFL